MHCSVAVEAATEFFPRMRAHRVEVWQMDLDTAHTTDTVNLREELEAVGIEEVLTELDRELIGLAPESDI
jgi:hypothetical protein